MPSSRISHWHTAGLCLVPAAVLAVPLLMGVVANSVPPGQSEQGTTEVAATTTTTTLTTSATQVAQNTPVTLTATVDPANAAGTVQFKDGANVIATRALSDGTAVVTQTLAVGSHSLTATFVPTSSTTFGMSTSVTPVTVVVGAGDTTTTLTTSVFDGNLVTLNAMLTPANAVGTVQFRDGAVPLGDPQRVINGGATTTSRLRPGTHALIAEFIPTNGNDFNPSRSNVSYVPVGRGADSRDALVSLDAGILDDQARDYDYYGQYYGQPGTFYGPQGTFDDRRRLLGGRVAVLDDQPLLNVRLGLG